MSSVDIASVLPARESPRILRIALSSGELHRIVRGVRHVRVLAGAAWITEDGRDMIGTLGSCIQLTTARHPTLVSGLGGQPLLFEVW